MGIPTQTVMDGIHPGVVAAAKKDACQRLAILNETLAHRTFLVGERLSLADLSMATTLVSAFRYVLDEEWRSRHRHLVRWWNTVLHQRFEVLSGWLDEHGWVLPDLPPTNKGSLDSLMGGTQLATHEAQPLKAGAAAKDKKKSVPQAKENVAASRESDENISQSKKEETPELDKEKTSPPAKENTPQFKKETTPQPKKEKNPSPSKEKTPDCKKEKSPPTKERATLSKEKTTPPKEETTPPKEETTPLKEKTTPRQE